MVVLAITASTHVAEIGVATSTTDGELAWHVARSSSRRGRDLLPLVESALAKAEVTLNDLQFVAVDRGPGSFTGVRLGVTVAKTLAYALEIPCKSVTSLDVLAFHERSSHKIACMVDAGRNTSYVATYLATSDASSIRPIETDAARVADDVARKRLKDHNVLTPDAESLASRFPEFTLHACAPTAAGVLRASKSNRAQTYDPSSVHTIVPLYLQASAPEELMRAKNQP